jgi:hypothetical protein
MKDMHRGLALDLTSLALQSYATGPSDAAEEGKGT